jgi:hypothetical protein
MIRAGISLLAVVSSAALAQDITDKVALQKCRDISAPAERLACFDEAIKETSPPAPPQAEASPQKAGDPALPKPLGIRVMIRDSAAMIDYGALKLGTKGTSISLVRNDGKDATVVKAGVIAIFRPITDSLQPFMALSWNRDATKASPEDIRDFSAGLIGPLWDSTRTVLATWQLSRRTDIHGPSTGNIARAHFDYIDTQWVSGLGLGGFTFVPQFGLILSNRGNGGAITDGTWKSGYLGFSLGRTFAINEQKFSVNLLMRKLHDFSVPNGNSERNDKYTNLSVDYFLVDPDTKGATWLPSLFLSRSVGTDSLSGVTQANKTMAGIRFKLN